MLPNNYLLVVCVLHYQKMIMQIMANFSQILVWPVRPSKTELSKTELSVKEEEFLLCYMEKWRTPATMATAI